jgi:CheY-like chemotaxis protein
MATCIAVIDDDRSFLELMKSVCEDEIGYQTLLLSEGQTAVARVRDAQPSGIILDLHLEHPDSGWAILDAVKHDLTLTGVPIIVCSADLREMQKREKDLKRYHCEVMPKPFRLNDMRATLRRLMGSSA